MKKTVHTEKNSLACLVGGDTDVFLHHFDENNRSRPAGLQIVPGGIQVLENEFTLTSAARKADLHRTNLLTKITKNNS